MKRLLPLVSLVILVLLSCQEKKEIPKQTKKPNILFLAVDDLRPELGCYGSVAKTPNLDQLASEGLLFDRAYCQQAICGASRASIMTGLRPETSGVLHNYRMIRDAVPNVVTLPQYFRENGYETSYTGKIFHGIDVDKKLSWSYTPPKSLLDKSTHPLPKAYHLTENQQLQRRNKKEMIVKYGDQARFGLGKGPAFEFADAPDHTYSDGYNTDLAIEAMKQMLKRNPEKPFFLGLGMKKPHLDWVAPKKYWDMYSEDDIQLTTQTEAPKNGSPLGLHPSFELRVRAQVPKIGGFDEKFSKDLKHAYLACVSYVDAQLGKMIDALDEAGVRENTIIVLWADHGWHLGEMGVWGKATNYELSTRVPMIIWTPDMAESSRGKKTKALVELVDIYPTLCELAGLPVPSTVDGKSYAPLLENPNQPWKEAVFSQFPDPALREWGSLPLRPGMRETFFGPLIKEQEAKIKKEFGEKWDRTTFENNVFGYAMRTNRYRMIVWKDRTKPESAPIDIELFDHETDPNETVNIAKDSPEIIAKLMIPFKQQMAKSKADSEAHLKVSKEFHY